ncbi:MAG TPA: outer membrane protein assembly factor BamD [Gemmatimonadales bacterium]|nr:outer membrane protein assembly factor BamD [Gemmatimonadales bacterium]
MIRVTTGAVRALPMVALCLLGGCHHFDPRNYTVPEDLYQASMHQFRTGHFDKAQAGFQAVSFSVGARDTLYPLARFFLAESYFSQGDYVTAAQEFRRVADESPNHRIAPNALLRAADSYAKLWEKPDLDATNGQTALATYQELAGRFPDAPATRIAATRLRALNERFAQKEMDIGVFYFRRGAFDSAILYFKDLIASYPSASLVPEAYVYIVRSYHAIGYTDQETQFCNALRQFYPQLSDAKRYCGNGTAGR